MSITLSAGVRQSLTSLQSAASQSSVIQNRLATGKKVNSALDNPANFFTASGLNNRANDLSRLLDDMGQATKALQAADKGISAITKLVENAQSVAKQAKAFKIEPSVYTGAATTPLSGSDVLVDDLGYTSGDDFTITLGEGGADEDTIAITTTATMTVDQLVTAINNDASTDVTAALVDGQLEITDKKGRSIAVTAETAADNATVVGTDLDVEGSEDKRVTLQADYDSLMSQIDQLSKDSGYNGVNLLNGDKLEVQFNETGKSRLEIAGADLTSTGLKIDDESLLTSAGIDASLKSLKSALDTLRTQSATFGSNLSVVQNRQDFTRGMIDTLKGGADALTVADTNEEGASLLALQTRSQLAQTTLSMASQADQAVLRLF